MTKTTLLITDNYDPINNPYRKARDNHDETVLPLDPDRAILKAVDIVNKLQEDRISRINDQVKEAADSARREADNATDRIRQALEGHVKNTLDVEALTDFVRECFETVESDISAATVEHDEGTVSYRVVVY